MKKKRIEIWIAQVTSLIKALRFSALEPATQNSLMREMLYFNNSRFMIIAVVILVLETMNMVNVLCFSKSGLATPNNRQYFAMYLILFVSALLCLVFRRVLRNKTELLQRCYVGFTLIWVFWHAILSSIDLRHNPNIMVFVTGILAMSFLVRIKPFQMISILASGLLLLIYLARDNLSNGITVNAIIVTIVTILIFCSHYFSTLEELGYRQKMILQENRRHMEKQKMTLLSEQQNALLHHSREFLFLWDKELDTLILSGGRSLCKSDKEVLLASLCEAKEQTENIVSLRINNKDTAQEYLIESTLQFDCDKMIVGAVGLIIEK